MRKFFALLFVIVLTIGSLAGCSQPAEEPTPDEQAEAPADAPEEVRADDEPADAPEGAYEDGIYFAQEDGFSESSGWKYMVTIVVEDGKIVDADWNGAHVSAGVDKKTSSESGEYGMVAKGGAQAEWHEQAEATEDYFLEVQDPTAIEYTDDEGHTDAISGVSIHVVEFFDLAEKALAQGPVGRGPYEDGHYYAEEDEFAENGWKYTADVTVVNGYIVAANWNGIHADGGDDKKTQSETGAYGMVEKGGAQAEWHEQAKAAEAYLLEVQDPTAIEYTDDEGHTDAISGVSIHVIEFFDLVEKALADA